MIIYRTNDRVKLKIDSLEVTISPLSRHIKSKIQSLALKGDESAFKAAELAIKHGIKRIDGIIDVNGEKVNLELDEDKSLNENSLDDIFNLPVSDKLATICLALLQGIPDKFIDPITNKQIEGVSFINKGKSRKK